MKKTFSYQNGIERWLLSIDNNKITVTNSGESRLYKLDEICHVNQQDEYITITHPDNSFTQIKFEVDNFLVLDLYDKDSEFIESIGSHVFGEE